MADASNTIRPRILHIRPQPPVLPEAGPCRSPIGELLAGLPLETQWCGDVYRGLALLLRPTSDPPQAAIICLDGLGTPEFEFFSIISKLRRDLKVYVYSAAHSESRIAKAVELGATGPVTREAVAELTCGPSVPMTMEPHLLTSERVSDKPVSPVFPPAPTEPSHIDEQDAPKPARVPWLRYGDRPARVAPSHREPSPQSPNPNPQTPTPPPSYEPLLTEEELRALMSDDIAAIVGDDPQSVVRPVNRESTVPINWPDDDARDRDIP